MQYAVNIADLTKERFLAQWLIGPLCPNRIVVDCEPGRIDGGAVLLECDSDRAAAVVELIRKKWPPHQLRCYLKDRGGPWRRV